MMGKQDRQMQMIILDIDSMIPQNHLLRQIKNCVNFDFIYEKAKPYYSNVGRKSIDPIVMIKMLLIGYLYGIKSERRLEEEVSLNLAYRWFCDIDLTQRVPDHSTFSQNRKGRFGDNSVFREVFNAIVIQCIKRNLVSGDMLVADGSFLPANISVQSSIEVTEIVQQSSIKYLNELEKEMSELPGYQPPKPREIQKRTLDGGYDVGAVHRGLELLGIDGYTAIRVYQNNALRKGFQYDQEKDCFICEKGKELLFKRLVFKKSSQNYYRLYVLPRKECSGCPRIGICERDQASIRISASGNYSAFHRNKLKYQTPEYYSAMRLRKIWSEGTFSVLKREHNLKRIYKRGIHRATEECLLSATALNLKRMVKAV